MDSERTTRHLICQLSEDEIRDRAYRAGEFDQQIVTKESTFEVERKDHKAKLAALEGARRTLLREVRTKQTTRDVECEVEKLYGPDFLVRTTRTDTGELIHERAMTIDERQGQLVGINGGSAKAAAAAAEPRAKGKAKKGAAEPAEVLA